MSTDSILAKTFGGLVGTGKGSGMALMFFFACIIGLAISLSGYLVKDVRNIEADIADYELVADINISV